jgi:hypothetical protein
MQDFSYMDEGEEIPKDDRLGVLTTKMREVRDLRSSIEDLEQRLKQEKKRLLVLTHHELPDEMLNAKQTILRLPQEGNNPPVEFRLKPFYKANIDNNDPSSLLAYQWLEQHGEGDLIKRTITINLGKDSADTECSVQDMLADMGIEYDTKYGVAWNTLTSWLKDRHEQYTRQLKIGMNNIPVEDRIVMPPLELLGAYIGNYVDIKESKT